GAQATQAAFDRLRHRSGPGALRQVRAVAHPELRGDDDAVATTTERGAQQLLAAPAAVDIGRVEQGDALVDGSIDDRPRPRVVDASPEVVAADADHRDLD